MNLQKKGG